MKRSLYFLLIVLLVPGVVHARSGKRSPMDVQLAPSSGVEPNLQSRTGVLRAPAAGPLQLWTFDNGSSPDPQGWTSVDLTAQPPYFHVDTFAGLSGYAPLAGTKSLWCGRPACNGSTDCVLNSDGYGNGWEQYFVSQPFTISGNVTITFQLKYDSEPSYDVLALQYAGADQVLHPLRTWSGAGTESVSEMVPAAGLGGKITFLFKFSSDVSFSDEDQYDTHGAAIIDNIVISTPSDGTVDSQTFENVTNGGTNTPDFHWFASGNPEPIGDFSALFDGDTVLQEDPSYTDHTNFWGFFSGSPDNYACGGHPEQLSVLLPQNYGGIMRGIYDELQSPSVSLAALPAGHAAVLSFDVYPDLVRDRWMTYSYSVRSKVGGVWKPWKRSFVVYYDPAKTWKTANFNLNPLILVGATDIQVAIDAEDACPYFCSGGVPVTCHSHGPLIDNVQVLDGNTVTGSSILVSPVDRTTSTSPVSVTFQNVTTSGETWLYTSTTGPAPTGFTIGNGTYYNLSTTASNTGFIAVCINYDESSLTVPESSLHMMHYDTTLNPAAWVDITSSLDINTNTICGITAHLSPFAIGKIGVTGVGNQATPRAFALHQNVPNPFNPITTITYDVPAGGANVSIRVYDAAGRLVRSLVDGARPAGTQTVTWDGRDQFGSALASGVYFYKMTAGSFVESRRMVLLK